LNYDRHIDWQTPGGFLPEQGDFDLQWLSRSDYDSKRLYPLEGKERVSLGKWCAQTLPVPN
jgi:hypothetical protein